MHPPPPSEATFTSTGTPGRLPKRFITPEVPVLIMRTPVAFFHLFASCPFQIATVGSLLHLCAQLASDLRFHRLGLRRLGLGSSVRKAILRGLGCWEGFRSGSGVSEVKASCWATRRPCRGTMMTGHCDSIGTARNLGSWISAASMAKREQLTIFS